MNKRKVGSQGESIALNYLKKKGYNLRLKNYRCPYGEIDLIMEIDNTIVFVEVKYRKSTKYGYPMEAVNGYKQQKIYKTALWFISSIDHQGSYRFDVVSILNEEITHVENAFS